MRVLLIGPNIYKTKGGMTSVIKGIIDDNKLSSKYSISAYSSCIDGNIIKRLLYSVYALIKFISIIDSYDVFHINVASNGSSFRKALYVRMVKKNGKKVVLHVHGGGYLNFYDKLYGIKKRIIDRMWNNSDEVIALSEEWKIAFEDRFKEARIVVVGNGINTDAFAGGVSNLRETKESILFLGRLVKEKGIYELVDAVDILVNKGHQIKLHFAGSGDLNRLREYVKGKKLGQNVEFYGWIGEKEKIKLLSKCSIVAVPSYVEAVPLSLLEGMAAGKAIVSTKVGAIPGIIKDECNGSLVEPMSAIQLAEAIENVIHKIDNGTITGKENIQLIVNKYSWHRMHQLLDDIYSRV